MQKLSINSFANNPYECARRLNMHHVRLKKSFEKREGVFSVKDFLSGETIVIGVPEKEQRFRDEYSIEIGNNIHVLLEKPGRLINHSCDPNCFVVQNHIGGLSFVALYDIQADTEITFDYSTTEREIVSDALQNCRCGSLACRHRIEGFAKLPENHHLVNAKLVAQHLL